MASSTPKSVVYYFHVVGTDEVLVYDTGKAVEAAPPPPPKKKAPPRRRKVKAAVANPDGVDFTQLFPDELILEVAMRCEPEAVVALWGVNKHLRAITRNDRGFTRAYWVEGWMAMYPDAPGITPDRLSPSYGLFDKVGKIGLALPPQMRMAHLLLYARTFDIDSPLRKFSPRSFTDACIRDGERGLRHFTYSLNLAPMARYAGSTVRHMMSNINIYPKKGRMERVAFHTFEPAPWEELCELFENPAEGVGPRNKKKMAVLARLGRAVQAYERRPRSFGSALREADAWAS